MANSIFKCRYNIRFSFDGLGFFLVYEVTPSNLFISGILSAIGFILIAIKLNRKWLCRALGYDIFIDITATMGFMWFMVGTFSGAMVAIISGICISIVLWITKKFIGYEKLEYINSSLEWIKYPGIFK